ncbi:protein kinase [Gemmatimonadota bacterium]
MIGKTISHYIVVDKIGEGGMGAVYKAEDTTLNRMVALKTLSPQLSEDEESRERFVREAQAASAINHPNITTVYELLEEDGTHFISMEHVEGKTLREIVESGRIPVQKALDIILQTAEALEAAHGEGILHRDVKSANIMVNIRGQVKVMDFGLAHLEDRSQLTRTGTTLGTLSYSSPEMVSGKPVNESSEIFSLGCVFYELLTGQLPFQGSSEAEIVLSIISGIQRAVTEFRGDVSDQLETVVSRMLEKDQKYRYQDCGELIQDLESIINELDTSTFEIATPRAVKARKQKRLIFGVSATTIIVGAVLVLLTSSMDSGFDPDRSIVPPFDNYTEDQELNSLGIQAAFRITEAMLHSGLRAVPIQDALTSWNYVLSAIESGVLVESPVTELARDNGAGRVISGTYSMVGDSLQFSLHIRDILKGVIIESIGPISVLPNDYALAIDEISQRIVGFYTLESDERIALPEPVIDAAYRAFSDGMDIYARAQDSSEQLSAINHFHLAYELDPTFTRPLIYAGFCHWNNNAFAQVDSLLRILDQHRERLNEYDVGWLEYLHGRIRGDLERSLRGARQVAQIAPGSKAEYNVGHIAVFLNRPGEALEAFERLDRKDSFTRSGFSFWTRKASAYHLLGEYRNALKIARQGFQLFPEADDLIYDILHSLAALGRVEEIHEFLEETHNYQNPSPAYRMRRAAADLKAYGQYPEVVIDLYQSAIDWYENARGENKTQYRSSIANALYEMERFDEAEVLYKELTVDSPSSLTYLGYLGTLAARRGDDQEALRIFDLLASIDQPYMFGNHIYLCARIAAQLGDKERAVRLLHESFEQGARAFLGVYRDMDLVPLRGFQPFEELIRPKG